MIERSEIGAAGEDRAQEFLLREGFTIFHRNWRNGIYELDFVAEKDGVLHIVEVKTRLREGLTTPEAALTRKKIPGLVQSGGILHRPVRDRA